MPASNHLSNDHYHYYHYYSFILSSYANKHFAVKYLEISCYILQNMLMKVNPPFKLK